MNELPPQVSEVLLYQTADGHTRVDVRFDVIISVGYRVKSHRGTQFRAWATQRLSEYILKGFTLDDERLKRAGGGGYFDDFEEAVTSVKQLEAKWPRRSMGSQKP